jgi:hypothetical protein
MTMPVAIGFAVVSGLAVLRMVVLARRAWQELPPGALIPVHGGSLGWDKWRPKERALLIWPFGGAVVWVVNVGIAVFVAVAAKSADGADVLTGVLVIPVIILAVSEQLALKAARKASQSGSHG